MDSQKSPELIAGRYQVISQLGVGGMSVVYLAYDPKMDRHVAIKLLKTTGSQEEMVLRFHREAKTASQLNHPKIIKIYDFGVDEDEPYMVLEHLEGKSLDEYLDEVGPLRWVDTAAIVVQICEGMTNAHKNNVVHRDLKCSNIMLTGTKKLIKNIKILDFGIAKVTEVTDKELTQTGLLIGSPNYMSPEQGLGQEIDQRSDIYSLGCMIYQMLTGRKPFDAETSIDIVLNQIEKPAPTLIEAGYSFDNQIEKIVEKCLKKNPSDRFENMDDLKTEIERILGSKSDSSRFITNVPRQTISMMLQKDSNSKWIVISCGSLILLLVSFFVIRILSFEPEKINLKTVESESFNIINKDRVIAIEKKNGNRAQLINLTKYEDLPELKLWSSSDEIVDSDLKYITPLKVELLGLVNANITDEGLKEIAKIKTLKSLVLNKNKKITDSGIASLKKLPNLEVLSISKTKVTNIGLEQIAQIKTLKCLDLRNLKNIDSISALKVLPRLKCLLFEKYSQKSKLITELSHFSNLKFLYMDSMGINDNDLKKMPQIPLSYVALTNNEITDSGLKYLTPFTTLEFVDLRGNKVTNDDPLEEELLKYHSDVMVFCKGRANKYWLDRMHPGVHGLSLHYMPEFIDDPFEYFRKHSIWHGFSRSRRSKHKKKDDRYYKPKGQNSKVNKKPVLD